MQQGVDTNLNPPYNKGMNQTSMNKTLTTLLFSLVSMSSPALAQSSHSAHVTLSKEIQKVGIDVYVNHKICDSTTSFGMYVPNHSSVVICQQNRVKGSRDTVEWTEEDYDTLRHEVHHVVQDCVDKSMDGILASVYKKPLKFGVAVLGSEMAMNVAQLYEEQGATPHIQVMEVEAFAVAAQNNPTEQVRDIKRYCF